MEKSTIAGRLPMHEAKKPILKSIETVGHPLAKANAEQRPKNIPSRIATMKMVQDLGRLAGARAIFLMAPNAQVKPNCSA